MPKRRVKSDPQAQASARRQRQTRSPVTPAQPEPIDRKPLSTNVGYAQHTKPTSDCQMFNEVKLKQLTDAIAAGINTAHINVITTDSGTTYDEILRANPECTTALFKYRHTIRLWADRSINLG